MSRPPTAPETAIDCVIVGATCFGWFILVSAQAVASDFSPQPFTDDSLLGLIVREAVYAGVALCYLHARGYRVAELLPVPSAGGSLVGLALFVATALVCWPIYAAVSVAQSAPQPIEEMMAGARLSLAPIVAMSVVNGLYEEVFLLGYLQSALERFGLGFAVSASLLVRMAYHTYQGPGGTASALAFGLVLAVYFARRRKLWPVAFAHILADIQGLAL